MELSTGIELSSLLNPLANTIRFATDEAKDLLEIGLNKYLNYQIEVFFQTNTFIHTKEKVNFYDIYYPLSAKYRNKDDNFTNLNKTLNLSKRISLIGAAGSGKSTITKYIFLECIQKCDFIPILIQIRDLNDSNLTLEDFILSKILENNIKSNSLILERSLKNGSFLFIFDGYDEIHSTSLLKTNKQIQSFIDKYNRNRFIITSRPGTGAETFNNFKSYYVNPLSKLDIISFVSMIVENQERKSNINKTLRLEENEQYLDIVSNPLMLSMFILTFEKYPNLPNLKSRFYSNVWHTLISQHDGITKNSYQRKPKTGLKDYQLREIIDLFSYGTFLRGQIEFHLEDIAFLFSRIRNIKNYDFENNQLIYDFETTTSIWIKDGLSYRFPHRSLQEFFCCSQISQLPEEQKSECFKRIINDLLTSSNDNYENFLNLYAEMDSIGLYKHFHLKMYSLLLEKKSPENSLDYLYLYIEKLNIKVEVVKEYKRQGYKLRLKVLKSDKNRITKFLDLTNSFQQFNWLFKAINNFKFLKTIDTVFRDNKKRIYRYEEDNNSIPLIAIIDVHKVSILQTLFKIVKDSKFESRIKKTYLNIQSDKSDIQNKISSYDFESRNQVYL